MLAWSGTMRDDYERRFQEWKRDMGMAEIDPEIHESMERDTEPKWAALGVFLLLVSGIGVARLLWWILR